MELATAAWRVRPFGRGKMIRAITIRVFSMVRTAIERSAIGETFPKPAGARSLNSGTGEL